MRQGREHSHSFTSLLLTFTPSSFHSFFFFFFFSLSHPYLQGNSFVLSGYVREGNVDFTRAGIRAKGVSIDDETNTTYMTDPSFLAEGLTNGIQDYLASLGVDEEMLAEIEGYVADKEYAEYTNLLAGLKKFLDE